MGKGDCIRVCILQSSYEGTSSWVREATVRHLAITAMTDRC